MENNISLASVFFAGLVSFLSPCVIPVLPTYAAILAGSNINDVKFNSWRYLINASCFFMGFTLVFVSMGATASYFGQLFLEYQDWISKIGALFIILMGFNLLGIIKINLLQREYRPLLAHTLQGPIGAFVMGIAFTAGWTPCIGPILASILVYAGSTATVYQGALLLLVYAIGFAVPFLIMAVVLNKYLNSIRILYRWLPLIQRLSGIIMIMIGIIIFFNLMNILLGVLWS